jgi:peptidoglycan L-alanyl-D-glutamate endopeptidase CwlK
MYTLGARSKTRLKGVHPDLVKVVARAIEITTVDFTVLEGLRTPERQKTLMEAGASQTLNSRHITGHAVDLGAWVENEVRWDWPLYHKIAAAMKEAAKQLDIAIVWGGDWRSFKDGPHFELNRKTHP